MALEQELAKSTKAIEGAIRSHKTPRVRSLTFGMGGITLIVGAVREFCKNWPEVKKELEKIAAFLRQHNQDKAAGILEAITTFLGAVAKLCPFVP